jgi:error-prone DNA polymerase
MRLAKGLAEADAHRISAAVGTHGPYETIGSLWRASGVSVRGLNRLAEADAFGSMGLTRRQALWSVKPLRDAPLPLFERSEFADEAGESTLPLTSPYVSVVDDYASTGLSLKAHPLSFMRDDLAGAGITPATDLRSDKLCPNGRLVTVAGLVLVRQRPGTASGVVFITLEDETGIVNLVIWPNVYEQFRRVVRLSKAIMVSGTVEREGEVVHVHARQLSAIDDALAGLASGSRDFH